ncbi:MAG: hypothetical protein IKO68_06745 [Oscillospiraceae bacterium]|nr:hypothetical protein [Oscillospiraceae bacterium]
MIRELLDREPDGWTGTASNLLDMGYALYGEQIAQSARGLAYKLERLEASLLRYDNIMHTRRKNGSGGGIHFLYRKNDPAESETMSNGINGNNGNNGRPDSTDEGNDSNYAEFFFVEDGV